MSHPGHPRVPQQDGSTANDWAFLLQTDERESVQVDSEFNAPGTTGVMEVLLSDRTGI